MITIKGLSKKKYSELVKTANEKYYRYTNGRAHYNAITDGYDITFSSEITAYIVTSYSDRFSTVHLLALGQSFIVIEGIEYKELIIE